MAQQAPNLLRYRRNHWSRKKCDESTRFKEITDHTSESCPRLRIARLRRLHQLPRLLCVHIAIRGTNEFPQLPDPLMEREGVHRLLALAARRLPLSGEWRFSRCTRRWRVHSKRTACQC